jgi:hypothetical protein
MFCESTKEGAAQAMAGEFQGETRNVEVTVRIQQQVQIFIGQNKQKWSAALTMSMSNKILLFCYRSRNETYVKKL